MSILSRVFLEKVNGEFQGASFMFRSGFRSGVMRMSWARDSSLFIGETNRGWGSAGEANEGLQRLVWNNKTPFEMKAVRAMPDGFEIEFTLPVDPKSAEDLASYTVESYIYKWIEEIHKKGYIIYRYRIKFGEKDGEYKGYYKDGNIFIQKSFINGILNLSAKNLTHLFSLRYDGLSSLDNESSTNLLHPCPSVQLSPYACNIIITYLYSNHM